MDIKVSANPLVFADVYVIKDMAKLMKMNASEMAFEELDEQLDLLIETGRKVFGCEQYSKIENALRKQNDGYLPIQALGNFLGEAFRAFAPKNS